MKKQPMTQTEMKTTRGGALPLFLLPIAKLVGVGAIKGVGSGLAASGKTS